MMEPSSHRLSMVGLHHQEWYIFFQKHLRQFDDEVTVSRSNDQATPHARRHVMHDGETCGESTRHGV